MRNCLKHVILSVLTVLAAVPGFIVAMDGEWFSAVDQPVYSGAVGEGFRAMPEHVSDPAFVL